MSAYKSELDLVETFLDSLAECSPWGSVSTRSEFFYQRGKTDVVAVDDHGLIIAFEAKLTKWKEALQQAYRNTCFAHRSYVVLPKETALLAYRHTQAFNRRRVGICYMEGDTVVILEDAVEAHPVQPWLSDKARCYTIGSPGEYVAS